LWQIDSAASASRAGKADGRNDICRFPSREWAQPVGPLDVPGIRLLPWNTVLENVALAAPDRVRRRGSALEALKQVGLAHRAKDWPAVLSGGQRQRIALARALASEARLILFDEPLGALDALTRLEMQNLIEKLWQQREFTAVLVTHDVEEAVALADRVLLMQDGEFRHESLVSLPRPRDRSTVEFAALKAGILSRVLTEDR
jgi:sulfonate transport system ATP-binding protein